jgi:hypothetical protein
MCLTTPLMYSLFSLSIPKGSIFLSISNTLILNMILDFQYLIYFILLIVIDVFDLLCLQSGQSWPKRWFDFTLNIGPSCPRKVVRPVPIFSDVRFSYLALVQDKKNHVRFTGKCMLYSLCHLPPNSPCFSFLNKQLTTILLHKYF